MKNKRTRFFYYLRRSCHSGVIPLFDFVISSPKTKSRKSYCTTPGVGVGVDVGVDVGVGVSKKIKVFLCDGQGAVGRAILVQDNLLVSLNDNCDSAALLHPRPFLPLPPSIPLQKIQAWILSQNSLSRELKIRVVGCVR